jgi:vacuolar-type H+-ATPase subunit I/STV1
MSSSQLEEAIHHPQVQAILEQNGIVPTDLGKELKNPNSLLYKSIATFVSTQELIKQITLQQQLTQQLITQQKKALNDTATNARTPENTLNERQLTQEQQAQRLIKRQLELQQLYAQKEHLQSEIKSLSEAQSKAELNIANVEQQQREVIATALGTTAEQVNPVDLEKYNSAQTTETELKTISGFLRSNNINKDQPEKSVVSYESNFLPHIIAQLSILKTSHTYETILLKNLQISKNLAEIAFATVEKLLKDFDKPAQNTAPLLQPSWVQKNIEETEDGQTTARTPFKTTPFSIKL